MCSGAFRLINHVESDERDRHRHEGPEGVEDRVSDVESRGVSSANDENEYIDWNDIDDKHVTAPGSNHVIVR